MLYAVVVSAGGGVRAGGEGAAASATRRGGAGGSGRGGCTLSDPAATMTSLFAPSEKYKYIHSNPSSQ